MNSTSRFKFGRSRPVVAAAATDAPSGPDQAAAAVLPSTPASPADMQATAQAQATQDASRTPAATSVQPARDEDGAPGTSPTGAAEAPVRQAIALGIDGLPEKACDLVDGGLYALKARTSSARFGVFSAFLREAMAAGRTCHVVCPASPAQFMQRLDATWELSSHDLIAQGRLKLFSAQPEVPKKIFRFGADRFLQELVSFGLEPHGILLFDQADDLISLHDAFLARQQLDVMTHWFLQNKVTAFFSFSNPSDRQGDTFNTLMDYFAGIARLQGGRSGLELTFVYWQSTRGATAARTFLLETPEGGSGAYRATETIKSAAGNHSADAKPTLDRRQSPQAEPASDNATPDPQATQAATDNLCILCNDPQLAEQLAALGQQAQRLDNLQTMVDAALAQAQPAIVLNLAAIEALDVAARVVHHLRLHLGPKVPLIVYDSLHPSRFSAQDPELTLLTGCGATLVADWPTFVGETLPHLVQLCKTATPRPAAPEFEALWSTFEQFRQSAGLIEDDGLPMADSALDVLEERLASLVVQAEPATVDTAPPETPTAASDAAAPAAAPVAARLPARARRSALAQLHAESQA